jgi:hypothetical protein
VNRMRGPAAVTGIMFIAATAAGVLSVATLGSLIEGSDYTALLMPLALQEMVLAVRLVVKGFDPAAIAAGADAAGRPAR